MKNLLIAFTMLASLTLSAQEKIVPGVTVTGEGSVYVVPDQVVLNIAIEHEGDYVKKIRKRTAEDVDEVLSFLKKQGIPKENIQTEYVYLNQQYHYETKEYTYSSRQGISIKIEDLEQYESIVSGLMKVGVNRINDIQFKSSKIEEYKAQARIEAVKNAKQKAQTYAQALGQKIGKANAIVEANSSYIPVMRRSFSKMSLAASSAEANKNTIAPGKLEVKTQVTVNFNLLE